MDNRNDLFDYEVIDARGDKIGNVEALWADEATGQPEFASVKTGWIFGREHIVPIRQGQIDHRERAIRLGVDKEKVKDAPSFEPDHDLSPQEEQRVYEHYGLTRSTQRSPTGLPGGRAEGLAGGRTGEREAVEMPLREEKVDIGKREVPTGEVHLRKIVKTDTVREPVELRRERVDVERVPASELRGEGRRAPGAGAFQEDEVVMRERREEPVVDKHTEVTGGVRAKKEVRTERRDVEAEVRSEDVEVDRDRERKDRGLF